MTFISNSIDLELLTSLEFKKKYKFIFIVNSTVDTLVYFIYFPTCHCFLITQTTL